MKNLVFLCGARDFHAMDWYRAAKSNSFFFKLVILTDLIESEGYNKLIDDSDFVYKLLILDPILFKKESKIGNYWRNFLKIIVFPIQLILILNFKRKYPNSVYHAHSMYYLWLAWAARLNYVGTPQGSDILIKPVKSSFYKFFSRLALKSAKYITVDSKSMSKGVFSIAGIYPQIIQNGIDLSLLTNKNVKKKFNREKVVSIRGFSDLYCINEILEARNNSFVFCNQSINFIYPFADSLYKGSLSSYFRDFDIDIGRLERNLMFELLLNSFLVLSIPISDSSPRSVYEAIFCGCAVAIRYNSFYDDLPNCMKSRIILINFNSPNWFDDVVNSARTIVQNEYSPSLEALNNYDQLKSSAKMIKLLMN